MADQSHDPPGASGALPPWWANVPKPLQHGTGEYQPPGYPTTTSAGVPTRFVPGPLNSGQLNQALDELQGQISGFVYDAPLAAAAYGRSNATWTQVLALSGGTLSGPVILAGNATSPLQPVPKQQLEAAIPAVPAGPQGAAGPSRAASTVPGPQGPAGPTGATGPQGPTGASGSGSGTVNSGTT